MPASTSMRFSLIRLASAQVWLLSALALCISAAWGDEIERDEVERGKIETSATNPQNSAPAYPSVQENLKAMDQDGDGQVSVLELRAYLETRHGKGYEQKVMDDLELSAKGRSCGTPFAQSFY